MNLALTSMGFPTALSYRHLPTTFPANSKWFSLRWEGRWLLGCTWVGQGGGERYEVGGAVVTGVHLG